MKYLIAFALATIVSVSCKKQDDATPDPQVPMQQVVGVWKISSYVDNNGRDKTSRFSDYNFSFLTGGNAEVLKNTTLYKKGTWANGSSYWTSTIVLRIDGLLPEEDLADLNEDWRIQQSTTTVLKVQNGGGKTLIFGK